MRILISTAMALFLVVTTSHAQDTNKTPTKPKENTCQSIAQYDNQTEPARTRLLQADVPAGGKFISVGFKVRQKDGDPFVDCKPGRTCNGAVLSEISQGSGDVDGALVFGGTAGPQSSGGFNQPATVRLVVTYSATSLPCVSESTFAGYQSKAEFQFVYMPEKASYAGWGDFFRRIDYRFYTQCDDSTGTPNNHEVCKKDGGVEFHPVNADKSDLERGMRFTCSDNSGSEIRCKAKVRYNP